MKRSGRVWAHALVALVAAPVALTVASCDLAKQAIEKLEKSCRPDGAAQCSKDGKQFLKCTHGELAFSSNCRGDKGCYKDGTNVRCDESKAVAGEHCSSEGNACSLDGKTALKCKDDVFVAISSCEGPKGCYLEGDKQKCDGPRPTVGAPCDADTAEGTAMCSADGEAMVKCESHVYATYRRCRGARGCWKGDDAQLHCDESVAGIGDPCGNEGSACSVDGKSVLACKDGAMVLEGSCPGPHGCAVHEGSGTVCDGLKGQVGGPCATGTASCSSDEKALLVCEGGAFARSLECAGPRGCYETEEKLRCDGGEASEGAPCKSGSSCSADHRSRLRCKDGRFEREIACGGPKGCWQDDAGVHCAP